MKPIWDVEPRTTPLTNLAMSAPMTTITIATTRLGSHSMMALMIWLIWTSPRIDAAAWIAKSLINHLTISATSALAVQLEPERWMKPLIPVDCDARSKPMAFSPRSTIPASRPEMIHPITRMRIAPTRVGRNPRKFCRASVTDTMTASPQV